MNHSIMGESATGDQLQQALESLGRTIQANPRSVEPEQARQPAKIIQLPLWPETRRAAPNAGFRSALFPALNFKAQRPLFREQRQIFAVGGVEVFFNGERFDQSDLDVYLELLDLARNYPLGSECAFSAHGLLKRLNRRTGLSAHKWLHRVLIRLRTSTVEIIDHRVRYFGGLIEGGFKHELDRHYRVTINPKFAVMFGYGMWSSIDREQRYALGRNATAKALHAYYSTHAAPGAHSFGTLASIIGREDSNKSRLRAHLIKAHELLKGIGFLNGYKVQDDTIAADMRPTPGQARHLVKKLVKRRHDHAKGTV